MSRLVPNDSPPDQGEDEGQESMNPVCLARRVESFLLLRLRSRSSIWSVRSRFLLALPSSSAAKIPDRIPIYSVEVVTTSSHRSLVANCGLRLTAHKTFRELRGKIDTLLVAGGNSIERDEINPEVVRWLRKIAGRIRRVGSVCTGAMLLARAGLLDGRRATTHWNWCEVLIRRAPRARLIPIQSLFGTKTFTHPRA